MNTETTTGVDHVLIDTQSPTVNPVAKMCGQTTPLSKPIRSPSARYSKTLSSQKVLEAQSNNADSAIQATDQSSSDAQPIIVGRRKRSRAMPSAKPIVVPPANDESVGGGHVSAEAQCTSVPTNPIPRLAILQTQRKAMIQSQQRINQQALSLTRHIIGYSTTDEALKRGVVCKEAMAALKATEKAIRDLEKGKPISGVNGRAKEAANFLMMSVMSRQGFDGHRKSVEKEMVILAKSLPVSKFVESVPGFSWIGLAMLVGEAGDIGAYRTVCGLRKTMGISPPNEYKMLTKGGKVVRAIPRHRRSEVYKVGDSLIKGNKNKDGSDGKYRKIYVERKAFELARNRDMTRRHAHRRAQRKMEQELLKDLWVEWRKSEAA